MTPLVNSSRLSLMLSLCTLLSVLSACGSTAPAESGPLPGDVEDVMARTWTSGKDGVAPSAFTPSSEAGVPIFHSYVSKSQVTPSVTAGNGLYLVVWKEFIADTAMILAARVRASDGAVLDASPLVIDTQTQYESVAKPTAAFDGTNFLVVYGKYRPSNYSYREDIFGKRVRASDGAVLDSGPIQISFISNSGITQNPTVTFTGSYFLVLWETMVSGWSLYGAYVQPSGQVITTTSSFAVAPNAFNSQLASGPSGNSLAVWSETPQGRIRVGWLTGTSHQAILFFTVADSGGSNPAIAYNGSTFLVVWNEAGGVVKARRVRLSQVQGQPFSDTSFTVGTGAISAATVSADAQNFHVTYEATRDGARQLISTRVTADGVVASGAENTLSDLRTSTGAERPASASLGADQKLVAYKQYEPAVGYERIKFRRVSDVVASDCTTGQPSIVLNGDATMTLECGSAAYVDAGAHAFNGCGDALPVTAYNSGADSSGPGPNSGAVGSYSVGYAAWDATGSANASRTVNVVDRTPPVLTLKGPAHSTHMCGSQWVDPGVTATDTCYGNLTAQVWHTGEVNGWAEGTYTVTYTLTDTGGNSTTPVQRTVEVVDCPW
ncbi:DUF5011 domain-containing protein [Hyalangium minutum]|uniref:DUF5011 domain-containing protein n=1 Tax=Hyalangium minutum TaxID=394096 RepID=UPI001F0A8B16|nr:DUF5011 domain-containing protein [Hyalangium minutum]